MSNYVGDDAVETVHDPESVPGEPSFSREMPVEEQRFQTCNRCRGTGLTTVDGLETDCMVCEGLGDIPI